MSYSTFNSNSSTFETSSLQPQIPQSQEIPEQIPQQIPQQNNTSNNKQLTLHEKIKSFLLSKSGTIITASFGMAIGFALKDFVSSIVVNLLKPLIALIFTMTHLNNYFDFSSNTCLLNFLPWPFIFDGIKLHPFFVNVFWSYFIFSSVLSTKSWSLQPFICFNDG